MTGPMTFELPDSEIELPPGDAPLVLIAPSTAHDSGNRVGANGTGSASRGAGAGGGDHEPGRSPRANRGAGERHSRRLAQLQPADAGGFTGVSHGGHGTVARALGAGTPVLICPFTGDMSETAMRVSWAGVGLSLPWRLCRPSPLRWAAQRILGDRPSPSGRVSWRSGRRRTRERSAAPSW